METIAAAIDPRHASARHQVLHHFVAKARWSDEALLETVAQRVVGRHHLYGLRTINQKIPMRDENAGTPSQNQIRE